MGHLSPVMGLIPYVPENTPVTVWSIMRSRSVRLFTYLTYSSTSAALIFALFSDSRSQSIASFVAACIVLYASEFMPKLLFAARPLRRTLAIAPTYRVLALLLAPFTTVAVKVTNLLMPRRESKYKLTPDELLRILQDRKDGVCLSDFESALITRLIVLRVKGKPITRDEIFDALSE